MPRSLMVAGLCLATCLAAGAPADAQRKLPTYRSPTFKGKATAPKTAPAPLPTPVPLAADGLFPDVLTDEAGTAHIVWTIDRGEEADGAVYCRLKRGASACDATTELVPDKPYGPGDGPQFSIDLGGPEIVRIGDQLVILSSRYPTGFDRPDGAGSGGVVQWTSDDGGSTWTGGVLAARYDINGGAIAFGPPDSPRIVTIQQIGACGSCVQQIRAGSYDGTHAALGDEGPDRAYHGSLAIDNGLPVAAFSDLTPTTFIRRWNGADPLTSTANWSPGLAIPGDEPWLAGGPAGLWLMNRGGGYFTPFDVRPIFPEGPGVAARVSDPTHDPVFGRLAQDPSGRLIAAWENRKEPNSGVHVRTATGGGTFGAVKRLLPGTDNGQLELAATEDGGGFVVANSTGGINSRGNIVAVGFGKQTPTGKPGILGIPGGGDPNVTQTCREARFGAVKVTTNEGCFLHGTGEFARVSVSEGEVDLNGLRLIPDAGVKIVIDPKAKKLFTTGTARLVLSGGGIDITLFHGKLELQLNLSGPGQVLASFDTAKYGVDLLGFGLRGKIDVILTGDGVRIPISIAMPPYFGDVRGGAELGARKGTGLVLESLQVHVGNVLLGPLLLEYFDLSYTRSNDIWAGKARLVFPAGGALDGSVEFQRGAFKHGSLAFEPPPPGIVVGPAVYITRIGGEFGLDPTHIGAEIRIGAGAAVNGVSPVSITGSMDATFPRTGPFTIEAKGVVSVLLLDLAEARLRFISDGYVDFSGKIGLDLAVISVDGSASGFVDGANGTFGAAAEVNLCIDLEIGPFSFPCVGGEFAISQKGMAACAFADLPEPVGRVSGGLELPWSDVSGAELLNPLAAIGTIASHLRTPCSTGDFVEPPRSRLARAAQAPGGTALTLPGGRPTITVALTGEGGPPDVDVTGPGGVALPQGSYIAKAKEINTSYVVIAKPTAGAWTFAPREGSPAITRVLQSDGYTPATVRATSRRDGARRAISYSIANGAGQTVQFAERGTFGTHVVGTATGTKGTLRFTPTAGRGGPRTIVALIQHNGLVTDRVTVASFTQSAPARPGRPGRVRVRQRGSSATITWRAARGAARYLVAVRGTHGLRRQFAVRGRSVRLTRLAPGDRLSASVTAISATGRRGLSVRSR